MIHEQEVLILTLKSHVSLFVKPVNFTSGLRLNSRSEYRLVEMCVIWNGESFCKFTDLRTGDGRTQNLHGGHECESVLL